MQCNLKKTNLAKLHTMEVLWTSNRNSCMMENHNIDTKMKKISTCSGCATGPSLFESIV